MIRFANILRRTLPLVPSRAGIPPTWDRPDPPSSRKVGFNRRLSWDEIHVHFLDGSTPTSMVVNPEIAEGDVIQAFPKFAKQLIYFFLAALLVGGVGRFWGSYRTLWLPSDYEGDLQRVETEKKQFDSKYGLKDLQNNPWKLNVWTQNFPLQNWGKQETSYQYKGKQSAIQTMRQINNEGLAFLEGLKAKVEEDLKKGGHHEHH